MLKKGESMLNNKYKIIILGLVIYSQVDRNKEIWKERKKKRLECGKALKNYKHENRNKSTEIENLESGNRKWIYEIF